MQDKTSLVQESAEHKGSDIFMGGTSTIWGVYRLYLPETQPQNPNDWRLLVLDEHGSHETTEFMCHCKINRVQLLYLPPHTSHKTQPLDRSVFSPLKNYFRKATKSLAHCKASAPANKQRFLLCYRAASRLGCSDKNIRSGFKKTGIWPYNPSVILDDPEAIIGDAPLRQDRTPTPPIITTASQDLLSTPRKSQDVREVLKKAHGNLLPKDRTLRALLTKMGKALDVSAAEKAALVEENNRLIEDFRSVQPYTKKRVREPPNDKIANIEDIIAAEETSHQPPKRRRRAPQQDPAPVVAQAQEMIIHGLDRIHEAEEI